MNTYTLVVVKSSEGNGNADALSQLHKSTRVTINWNVPDNYICIHAYFVVKNYNTCTLIQVTTVYMLIAMQYVCVTFLYHSRTGDCCKDHLDTRYIEVQNHLRT